MKEMMTEKKLPKLQKSTSVTSVLKRSKSLLSINQKLLKIARNSNQKSLNPPSSEIAEWLDPIWSWANSFRNCIENFPDDKTGFLGIKKLVIEFYHDECIGYLPDEIGNLTQLEYLTIHDFIELPSSITRLKNLKSLNLYWYYCEDIKKDSGIVKWLEYLRFNGCKIEEDCDIH